MSALPKALLIFAFVIPLAILMGFFLADPTDSTSLIGIGLVFFFLLLPFLIRHHHVALILSATAFINAFFLPGKPEMWMLLAGLSFTISIASWPLDRHSRRYCGVRSLDLSVLFLVAVVVLTAKANGGAGFSMLGGQMFGGRRYVTILAAAVGYFAFVLNPLSLEKAKLYGPIFWLMSGTAIFGNVAYALGENFYFLFYLFPVDFVVFQANAEDIVLSGGLVRLTGLAPLGLSIIHCLLSRYGLRGVLSLRSIWRPTMVVMALFFVLLSGFRSNIILIILVFGVLFFLEKLHRTMYAGVLAAAIVFTGGMLVGFSDRLPLTIQRALSFLPLKVDPLAKADAEGSLQWRFDMWKVVVSDIPKYFWVGKGFAINPTDLYFTKEALKRGFYSPSDAARLAGDYHNGPLSVMIPFGIWGAIAFLWFLGSSFVVLRNNYLHGSDALKTINRFFFAFFIARSIFFMIFIGALNSDFWLFASIVGLSLSMNRGMARSAQPVKVEAKKQKQAMLALPGRLAPTPGS